MSLLNSATGTTVALPEEHTQTPLPSTDAAKLNIWLALALISGVAVRLVQWMVCVPVYGDQAALGVNIQTHSYSQLCGPLDYDQVAPVGFLWIERAVLDFLGPSELAMRLPATIAGIAALPMLYLLARRFTTRPTSILAVAILSASTFCIRHSVEIKPYGIDFLCATCMFYCAVRFLQDRQTRSLAILTAITPLALLVSYPAIIVALAITIVLSVSWQSLNVRDRVFTFLMCMAAAILYLAILRPVIHAQSQATRAFMLDFWRDHFPPANPNRLLRWLVAVHSGSLFVYPIEGDAPWCAPGLLFVILGLLPWMRKAGRPLILLMLLPFALNILTAALRLYPYGEARLSQHLAPLIIVFTAMGTAHLITWIFAGDRRQRAFLKFSCLSLTIAAFAQVIPEIQSVVHPSRSQRLDYQIRDFDRTHLGELGPDPSVVLVGIPRQMPHTFEWYARASGSPFDYNKLPTPNPSAKNPAIWVFLPTNRETADTIARQVARPVAAHYTLNGNIGDINAFEVIGFAPGK